MRSSVSWLGAVSSCESFTSAPHGRGTLGRDGTDENARPGPVRSCSVKRWESEGDVPSGRSSSMRSMRCMGKKTTAGDDGLAVFDHGKQVVERGEFDSAQAQAFGGRARTAPQNFSRGLESVRITRAPRGKAVVAEALGIGKFGT